MELGDGSVGVGGRSTGVAAGRLVTEDVGRAMRVWGVGGGGGVEGAASARGGAFVCGSGFLMTKKVPVVVGLGSVSFTGATGGSSQLAAHRVEGLDVRVPGVVGQLEQTRKDAGKARAPRRRLLGQWHGAGLDGTCLDGQR